jgi:hypothetical protein
VAERIEAPPVTVPAGTAIATPQTTALTWLDGRIVRIEIRVPRGAAGLVGFQIGHSNQVIIPHDPTQWIIGEGETLDWDVDNYPTGAKWFVRAYNTGRYAHTLYFRFHLVELVSARAGTLPPLSIVAVGESADVGA